MKIRINFVSNSSSSFIIAGNDVKKTLQENLKNNERIYTEIDGWKEYFEVGLLNEKILEQCEYSDIDMIKQVICDKFYESIEYFKDKIYYEKIYKKRNNYFIEIERDYYDKNISNTIFALTDEIKNYIEKEMIKHAKTAESSCQCYYFEISEEIENKIKEKCDSIYESISKNNNEVYAMSFGDNHGECTGEIGFIIESDYLGKKEINNYLKTNFDIYKVNEH